MTKCATFRLSLFPFAHLPSTQSGNFSLCQCSCIICRPDMRTWPPPPPLWLLLLVLPVLVDCQTCRSDGKYCNAVLSVSMLSTTSLSYKCSFPIYLAKNDILALDPTVFITMKIGEYCPKSCCSVTQTTTTSTTSSSTTTTTTPSTTSPTTPSTTTTTTTPSTTSTTTSTSTTTTTTPTTTTSTTPPTTTVYKTPLEKFNDVMNADGAFKSLMDEINFSSSASEGLKRYNVYKETKKQVDEHNVMFNLGMSTFKMATNAFSVALKGEIAPLTLSLDALTPTTTVTPSIPSDKRKRKRDTVTPTVDWRPYMKPILNQLTCGGCWAFSMVAMVEGFFAIQGYNTTSLSVQQLLTCDTKTDATYGVANVGCKGGYFQVAGSYLEVTGERDASEIPFDLEDTDCDSASFPPVVPTILLFDDGFVSGNQTAAQLTTLEQNIEAKVRKGPVSVGMAVSQDIYSYASGVYDGNCGSTINHAVVIVGFTDDYWIIRNSWGTAWGEDGYIRVKRTSGTDPCQLYSYWSQATAIGANETYVPPKVGGGEYVIPGTSTQGSTSGSAAAEDAREENDCGEVACEEQCGCDYDDDDDEDEDDYYEGEEEEEDEETTETETTSTSTSTSTSTPSTSTSTSTSSSSTTTEPSTTPSTTSTTTSTTRKTSTTPLKTTTKTTTTPKKPTTTTTPRRTTTTARQSLYDKWVDGWNNFWG